MAADSRSTLPDFIVPGNAQKLRKLSDGSIIGGAGTFTALQKLIEALEEDRSAPKLPFTALVLKPNGQLLRYAGTGGTPDDISECPYFAVGSGENYAFGAFACGKSAKEAVKIAAQFDPNTGGKIRTMKI